MNEKQEVRVTGEVAGVRADTALSSATGLPRSLVAKLISKGKVTVDGEKISKSTKLEEGQMAAITVDEPNMGFETAGPLEILYEDDHIVVVNKPVGMAAHTNPGWSGPTVLASLAELGVKVSDHGPAERRGIVSRLDVGTSGAMVVAKSNSAYSVLKHAFKDREVDRRYHALVEGHPDPMEGTIDAPIARHPSKQWKMAVVDGGREAITHYEVLELTPGAALLDVQLETGRTHQIRVHMSALGHPCLGDVFYGADPVRGEKLGLTRQWLHAREVGFVHPATGEHVTFVAPYPKDLEEALEAMREGLGLW